MLRSKNCHLVTDLCSNFIFFLLINYNDYFRSASCMPTSRSCPRHLFKFCEKVIYLPFLSFLKRKQVSYIHISFFNIKRHNFFSLIAQVITTRVSCISHSNDPVHQVFQMPTFGANEIWTFFYMILY